MKEGDNVELYERIVLFMTTEEIIGQLVYGKMKLKGDIAFNVKTDKVTGFTEDFADAKRIMRKFFEDDSIEGYSKLATQVNQWRYRSVDGQTYNLEFGSTPDHSKQRSYCISFVRLLPAVRM